MLDRTDATLLVSDVTPMKLPLKRKVKAPPEPTLAERAAAAAKAEITGDRRNLLGQLQARPAFALQLRTASVPDRWTVVHVMDQLQEAYDILDRIPVITRPKEFGNSMPSYVYDRADLNAQIETGELEKLLRVRNRVRLDATPAEVARMM